MPNNLTRKNTNIIYQKPFKSTLALLLISASLSFCSRDKEEVGFDEANAANKEDMVQVHLHLGQVSSSNPSLNLTASAQGYSITIENCVSGFVSTVTELSGSQANVYRGDSNCMGKLNLIQYLGATYVPTVADPFDTWTVGDTAIFENPANPGQTMKVTVVSQLSSPINTLDVISYTFDASYLGLDQSIGPDTYAESHALSTGDAPAPQFSVVQQSMLDITDQGAGKFSFVLECDGADVVDTGASMTCLGLPIVGMKYKLVDDIYSPAEITIDEADVLFDGLDEKTIDVADLYDVGQGGTTTGGFKTKDDIVNDVLIGPDDFINNKEMILIFKYNSTYLYFQIHVQTM